MKASMQHSMKLNNNDTPKNFTQPDNKFTSKSSIQNFYPQKEKQHKRQPTEKQMVQEITQYSLKEIKTRAKPLLIDYLKKILKITSFSHSIFSDLELLDTATTLNQMFEITFKILTNSMSNQFQQHHFSKLPSHNDNPEGLDIVIRSREAKRLRLIKQDDNQGDVKIKGRSVKKMQQFQKSNQNLKRQAFNLKQQNMRLQSKIVNLIDEYQKRKGFYVAEIKKLTEIIRMSSVDVRNLVLQKTKEAKVMIKNDASKQGDNSQININVLHTKNYQQKNNYDDGRFLKLTTKASQFNQDNYGVYNGYNTEFRLLKNISSIQNME